MVKTELAKRGWHEPAQCNIALKITYFRRHDLDNAAGFVMDVLQGVAYNDDKQITLLIVKKKKSMGKGIEIFLKALQE